MLAFPVCRSNRLEGCDNARLWFIRLLPRWLGVPASDEGRRRPFRHGLGGTPKAATATIYSNWKRLAQTTPRVVRDVAIRPGNTSIPAGSGRALSFGYPRASARPAMSRQRLCTRWCPPFTPFRAPNRAEQPLHPEWRPRPDGRRIVVVVVDTVRSSRGEMHHSTCLTSLNAAMIACNPKEIVWTECGRGNARVNDCQ